MLNGVKSETSATGGLQRRWLVSVLRSINGPTISPTCKTQVPHLIKSFRTSGCLWSIYKNEFSTAQADGRCELLTSMPRR